MKELGDFSDKLHRDCGKFLMESHAKLPYRLLTVGEGAKSLSDEVKKLGIEPHWVANQKEALAWVTKNLNSGDVLFVKGSHGVRLDLLVDALTGKN